MHRLLREIRERFLNLQTLKGVLFLLGCIYLGRYPEYIIEVAVRGYLLYEGLRLALINPVKARVKEEQLVSERKATAGLQAHAWPLLVLLLLVPPAEPCQGDCAITDRGVDLIKEWEGYVPVMYRDAVGKWTIGTGHLMTEGDIRRWRGEALTAAQGDSLLRRDVAEHQGHVNHYVGVQLWPWQFDALVSWTFNLGPGNLRRSTMLQRINAGQHDRVPREMERWNRAGGHVLRGLVRRRAEEAHLYEYGYE